MTTTALQLVREVEALIHPERHPPGTPLHDPDHKHWDSDDEAFQWDAETIEWVDQWLTRRLPEIEAESAAEAWAR